uniref:Transducin/WD40 repeat-like superfamily protein n=1 Tax=Zea mays TaxID=4577 RepID=A0A804LJF3_MAIZE
MGLSSKPLHRGVKHDISCLSQDSYGPYIAASCMDNIIYLYSVLHMNKGLIKVYTSIKIRVFFRQAVATHGYLSIMMARTTPLPLRVKSSLRHDFKFLKVENLGNQLVQQKGKPKIEVYEKDRKKGAGALTTHARVQ